MMMTSRRSRPRRLASSTESMAARARLRSVLRSLLRRAETPSPARIVAERVDRAPAAVEPAGAASAAFGEYISEQMVEERARKTSLEARGLALITTSGVFTTLVLGIAALVGDADLPRAARVLLVLSLATFLVAAVMGVVVNKPANYDEPSTASLLATLDEYGSRDLAVGQKAVAKSRLDVLGTARKRNDDKAGYLRAAAWAQIVAMGLVALAGIVTLIA